MKSRFSSSSHDIKRLAHWRRHLGPTCWLLTAQFFAAQVATAMAYSSAYNWGSDPISYLGITRCAVFGSSYVCSPLHAVFNASLVALGIATAAGAFCLYHQCHRSRATLAGFSGIGLAACGATLVGIFPANTVYLAHNIGAGLAIIGGLIGMFILAISLPRLPRMLRYGMMGGSTLSLLGLVLLALAFSLSLGFTGTAERLASYPGVLGLIVFGAYSLARHSVAHTPWPGVRARPGNRAGQRHP